MAQNAFGLASLYDPSIGVDQQQLDRQQALALALRKMSLSQSGTQMLGNVAVRNSPLEGVAKALQGLQATQMEGQGDAQRADMGKKSMAALVAALREEAPAGQQATAPAQSGQPAAGPALPAPQAPPVASQASGGMRNMGLAQLLKGNAMGALGGEQAAGAYYDQFKQTPDMKNMAAMGQDPALMGRLGTAKARKEGLMDVSPGNTVFDPSSGQPAFSAPQKPPQGFRVGPDGKNYEVDPEWFKAEMAMKTAGATRVQQSVNAFTPASEEAQKEFMKSTRTTYDSLKQAPVALASIEKAKALIPAAKGFMGPGGESLLETAKFLNNRVGMNIDTKGVENAEELRTRIFFNIMDNLKKMDAQPSEMQQRMMADALGKLGTDPNALPRVLDAFADVIRGKVEMHNKEVAGATQRGVKFPYDPTISVSAAGGKGLVKNPDGSYTYTP